MNKPARQNIRNGFSIAIISGFIGLTIVSCSKKEEETTSTNIATEVVANLAAISANYAPPTLTSSAITVQSNPCEGVSNFAVCQSNLIREYNRIGKEAVDAASQIINVIGQALGNLPDGSNGTSDDQRVTWNKTSAQVWSVIFRGASNQPQTYVSVNGSSYIVKHDKNVDVEEPADQQIEILVTFNSSENWDVDVYFGGTVCDALDPKGPSKARLRVGLANNLWTGKAMIYAPRWQPPGAADVTCATTPGVSEVAMYTDYVGNSISSKASLYMIPSSQFANNLSSIGNFDLEDFCTNFPSDCGGAGQPTALFLGDYGNPFCSTGPNTEPTWENSCTSNATVSGASYSSSSLWVTPQALEDFTVTVPNSL